MIINQTRVGILIPITLQKQLDKCRILGLIIPSNCTLNYFSCIPRLNSSPYQNFFKKDVIIRFSISYHHLLSKQDIMSGQITIKDPDCCPLKGKIFWILLIAPRDIKRLYRIPSNYIPSGKKGEINPNKVVDSLLAMSLKVLDLNAIFQTLSVALNLGIIEFQQKIVQNEHTFYLRSKSQLKANLTHLLQQSLLKHLQKYLCNFKKQEQKAQKIERQGNSVNADSLVRGDKQVVYELNNKLINMSADFHEIKEISYLSFPRLPYRDQQSPQNYLLNLFNNQILAAAMGETQAVRNTYNFDIQVISHALKQDFQSDINAPMLRQDMQRMKRYQQLKSCEFVKYLRESKLIISTYKIRNLGLLGHMS